MKMKRYSKYTAPVTSHFKEKLDLIENRLAAYLNNRTAHWRQPHLKILLVSFCLLTGGGSIFLVTKGIIGATGPPAMHHTAPTKPALLNDSTNNKPSKFNNDDKHK